jgi:arylsulfatase A-like enzyme
MPASSQRPTTRRALLLNATAAMGAASLPVPGWSKTGQKKRPNIVYIIADDLGVYDLGCYGQDKIKTPNLDRLAADGVRFTQAYGGAPICSPSRCALMTGRHMGHASIRDNFALAGGIVGHKGTQTVRRASLAEGEATVATHLQAAGYDTGLVGKWHLDGYNPNAVPTGHGFQHFDGWLTQTDTTQGYFPTRWYANTRLDSIPANENGRQAIYETDICTTQACDFIRAHKDRPFFLTLAYNAPHSPYVVPAFGAYAGESWGKSERTYAAMIEMLDLGVGSVMQALAEAGIDGDTIVFFSSDHGPRSEPTPEQTEVVRFFDSHGALRGYKRDLYEGGIRVPLLVRWPGRIAPGRTDATPVYHPDFLPTAVALAGAAPVPDLDGLDLSPLLRGDGALPERELYWETYEPSFWQAVRAGRWKAVRPTNSDHIQLFDLAADPSESRDVAVDQPVLVARLRQSMRRAHVPNAEYPISA